VRAAWRDLGAPRHGIPCRFGPLNSAAAGRHSATVARRRPRSRRAADEVTPKWIVSVLLVRVILRGFPWPSIDLLAVDPAPEPPCRPARHGRPRTAICQPGLTRACAESGAFVVGDRSATGSVTFWSPAWWAVNDLSGGRAPVLFNGFADEPAGARCGATWSARPGSVWAPTAVPTYMAVAVASRVTRPGLPGRRHGAPRRRPHRRLPPAGRGPRDGGRHGLLRPWSRARPSVSRPPVVSQLDVVVFS
jgi:hypothetical protein